MADEGETGRGIFHTPGNGRNFRRRRKGKGDALDRFAAALARHVDQDDIDKGRVPPGSPLDPGGNPRIAAERCGLNPSSGNGMLQRIRKRLGDQAR